MSKSYANAAAFRNALEARLRTVAQQRGTQIQGLRLKLAIERLLARLFEEKDPPWLLKGGYAMELRFRPKARTTRDVDLTLAGDASPDALNRNLEAVHEELQAAAERSLDDFFEFIIQPARSALQGAPGGGGVFPVVARMAGRDFARFHIDVGFGDPEMGEAEELVGDDLLEFIGVPPTRALAIPKAQQFAEKIHAYTFQWSDRENTRSRDLVDLVLLIERGGLELGAVRQALQQTFEHRARHELPGQLPTPPDAWAKEVPAMAAETGITPTTVAEAFAVLARFWEQLGLADS